MKAMHLFKTCSGSCEGKTFGSCKHREEEKDNVRIRRPDPHLMVHAIPFHPRNVVAIPKDPAFPLYFVVATPLPVVCIGGT